MKITRRQLTRLIREEISFALREAAPGGAKQVLGDAKGKIAQWMTSTRAAMLKGLEDKGYEQVSGSQTLMFALSEDGSVTVTASSEWDPESNSRGSKTPPVTSGHKTSLATTIKRVMRGKDPGAYTMSYTIDEQGKHT